MNNSSFALELVTN